MRSKDSALFIARIALGINMWAHGIVRIPDVKEFSTWMLSVYKDSLLPTPLVEVWAYCVPFIELVLGALIVVGLFTRQSLFLLGLYLIVLILGSCMIQKWEWAAFQMIYVAFVYLLLKNEGSGMWALDNLIKKK